VPHCETQGVGKIHRKGGNIKNNIFWLKVITTFTINIYNQKLINELLVNYTVCSVIVFGGFTTATVGILYKRKKTT